MSGLLKTAVGLFIAQGGVYLIIGALTPLAIRLDWSGEILFFSPRSDAGYFGAPTGKLLADDPNLVRLRNVLFLGLAGMLVVAGLVIIGWFALR